MATLAFELTKQYSSGSEKVRAMFVDEKDAAEFMEAKIAWDHKTKVQAIYRLYSDGILLAEIDSFQYETLSSAGQGDIGSSATSNSSAPRPTPGGMPKTPYSSGDLDDDDK